MLHKISIVVIIILTISCMSKTPVQYEYADGSANIYLLTENELRYLPVIPEESSTGFYSGGDPKTVVVTPTQFNELKSLFDLALEKTSIHIPDRMKTSGMISVMGSSKKQCIISPNSDEKKVIEAALKKTLGE